LTPNPETAELKKDTLQNINQISETDKKIIDLWNDGYCDSDIAQIVGLAAGTIQNKISRLRQKLGPEIVKKHYS
jgi:DNA-binding NarL/FixJ family response regulator